ncbi:MAG: DNA-binding protein [Bacteroidaceae bacterium]|nr:DNA-binding protein [Bacteroidaceae bacterium]
MAKYIKQEMPDIRKDGSRKCYYRMQSNGNVTTDELIHTICYHGGVGLSESVFRSALQELSAELARKMADGYSVTLDGVGTFRATIGVKEEKDMDTLDGDEVKRNAQSLEVKGVTYRADGELVKKTRSHCRLERGGTGRVNRSPYTQAERLQQAKAFLSDGTHPYMRLSDYVRLTRMSRTTASEELRALAADPKSGIAVSGRGTHIMYVMR